MIPHKLTLCLLFILFLQITGFAQKKPPSGGRPAVVVDERLAALRSTPHLNGKLLRRLSRGRLVVVRSFKTGADGITFLLVNVTRRTHGWIQRDAVVSPSRFGDDRRLLTLIQRSDRFDRISRARIFLDHFPRCVRKYYCFLATPQNLLPKNYRSTLHDVSKTTSATRQSPVTT